jgi:hypothetical protein
MSVSPKRRKSGYDCTDPSFTHIEFASLEEESFNCLLKEDRRPKWQQGKKEINKKKRNKKGTKRGDTEELRDKGKGKKVGKREQKKRSENTVYCVCIYKLFKGQDKVIFRVRQN